MNLLLLTATIRPPADAVALARADVNDRLQDYREAFAFYLAQMAAGIIDGLVLCDNSNHELTSFQRLADEAGLAAQVELISFAGLDHPAVKGRGYGEFKLVDHAMQHSRLLAQPGATIWKMTGRYRLQNLQRVIAAKPADAILYCNSRNLPVRWTDLYLLAWTRAGYDAFIRGLYLHLAEDGRVLNAEELFRSWLDERATIKGVVQRFRVVPRASGRRGVDNRDHGRLGVKHLVRVVANRLAPWIWI